MFLRVIESSRNLRPRVDGPKVKDLNSRSAYPWIANNLCFGTREPIPFL